MTSRTYDIIATVNSVTNFETGNTVLGQSSGASGLIAGISGNNLKIKLSNTLVSFTTSETILSNVVSVSGGSTNTETVPYEPSVFDSFITTASSTVTAINPSSFVAAKNAFTQQPVVKLFSLYYPGEWYPPNAAGNPTEQGEGYSWPSSFPIRFAEIVGDTANDISYNVIHNGISYIPLPVNMSGYAEGSDGKINEASIDIFNVDNIITVLVENPYLVGNNTSNSCMAIVNGELVHGIDPRTVNANPSDFGSAGNEGFDTLTRARANGLAYSSSIVAEYGQSNASFSYDATQEVKGVWKSLKSDTRDLLGGVLEVKSTFAHYLDYWPEYSLVSSLDENSITVVNSLPYRVGDNVKTASGSNTAIITSILPDHSMLLDNILDGSINDPVYIINEDADSESYIQDTFKIEQLESLSDHLATFGLVSWLQYFKIVTPKRKYYKNTCQWVYKGQECQYPGPGGLPIPGTDLLSNTNPLSLSNEVTTSDNDACPGSYTACKLRNNQRHFGGFPGTGRSLPKN